MLDNPRSVFVAGNYAYIVSSASNALEIVDVSNPAAPHHEGSIVNGGGALLDGPISVYVVGNNAYVGSYYSNSLEIVDIGDNSGIGIFRPSTHMFYLDYNGNGTWNGAVTDRQFIFGLTGDSPISGDWNGNGITEIGVFRPSTH